MIQDPFSSYLFYIVLAGIALASGRRPFVRCVVSGGGTYLILLALRANGISPLAGVFEPSIAVGVTTAMLPLSLPYSNTNSVFRLAGLFVVITLVATQRVLSGHHQLLEALTGLLIGCVAMLLVKRLLKDANEPCQTGAGKRGNWPEKVLVPLQEGMNWSRAEVADRYPGVASPLFTDLFLTSTGRAAQRMGRFLGVFRKGVSVGYSLRDGFILSNMGPSMLRPMRLATRVIHIRESYLEYYQGEYSSAKNQFWRDNAQVRNLVTGASCPRDLHDSLIQATALFEEWMFHQSVSLFYYTFALYYLRAAIKIHFPFQSKRVFSDLLMGLETPGWRESKQLYILGKALESPSSAEEANALLATCIALGENKFPSYDFVDPPLGSDPEIMIQLARSSCQREQSPDLELEAGSKIRRAAEKRLCKRIQLLHPFGGKHLSGQLIALTRSIGVFKEERQQQMGAAWANVRRTVQNIGKVYAERGLLESTDLVFFLSAPELSWLLRNGCGHAPDPALSSIRELGSLAKLRKNQYRYLKETQSGTVFAGRKATIEFDFGSRATTPAAVTKNSSATLQGTHGIGGIIEGVAVVIERPNEFKNMVPGRILVAPATNTHWDVLFPLASGLITETGSPLSHAFLKANEYGIPALLGVERACRRIKSGNRVRIDGERRTATILSN